MYGLDQVNHSSIMTLKFHWAGGVYFILVFFCEGMDVDLFLLF